MEIGYVWAIPKNVAGLVPEGHTFKKMAASECTTLVIAEIKGVAFSDGG